MKKGHVQNDKKRNKHRKSKSSSNKRRVINRGKAKTAIAPAEIAPVITAVPPVDVAPPIAPKSRKRKGIEPGEDVTPAEPKVKRTKKEQAPIKPVPPVELPTPEMIAEIEKVTPVIADDDLRHKKEFRKMFPVIYRAPFGREGGRYYFREGFGDFYASYSLWTKSVLPTNPGLIKWKVDKGVEGELIALTAREYGHIFHLFIARHESMDDPFRFKFNGPLSNEWREYIWATVAHHGLPRIYGEQWEAQLKNDYLAYINWKREYKVHVLAVEVPLFDDDFKIATPADMVVACLVKKSPYAKEPTEPAIVGVDFKSGESGVGFDEYMLQLEFIRHAWNKRFAGTKYEMTEIYNWHPKKRSLSNGGFHFVNQSGKFTKEQFIHLAQTCAVMEYNKPTGGLLKYCDGENELDISVAKVNPYDFLKAFFVK